MKLMLRLFCLMLWQGFLFAPAGFAADVAALLNAHLARIQSLEANFTQTIVDSHDRLLSESSGKLILVRPGKFRWEVSQPDPELVIANGKRLSIYNPDLQQLVVRTIKENDNEVPALLLSRAEISAADHFVVTQVSPTVFHLVPKNKGSLFASIELEFKGDDLVRMSILDHMNQTTRIVFHSERRNRAIAGGLFQFSPPKGTDVVYDTVP